MPRVVLANKPIAITGASSGIGLATAWACARAGMPVVIAARRIDRLDEIVAKMRSQGFKAVAVACDVTDPAACARVIDTTIDAFGSLYAVYANAGYAYEAAHDQTKPADLRAIFETNLWGTINFIDPALVAMKRAGTGHIVICSSCLSKIGLPFYGAYCATKASQDCIARAMRHELSPIGIAVSSVHPIGTRTELFDKVQERNSNARIASRTPRSMMQPPERVARAILRQLSKGTGGEVWTSFSIRLALAGATLLPGTTDFLIGKLVASRRKKNQ